MTEEEEVLQIYLEEAREHLSDIETDLLAIEKRGSDIDEELVNKVFRGVHSVKGGAGFVGLDRVNQLAHKLENVLGLIRSREMVPTPEIINALLQGFDRLKELLDNVHTAEGLEIDQQIAILNSTCLSPDPKPVVSIDYEEMFSAARESIADSCAEGAKEISEKQVAPELDPEISTESASPINPEPAVCPTSNDFETEERGRAAQLTAQKQNKTGDLPDSSQPESLRVNVSLLDTLMTLAGEMVLSRNQLLQALASGDKHSLDIASQRINLVTSELQEAIMITRMQPVGNVFSKFPRIVRDLSRSLLKEIQVNIEGKNVELDKTIIEGLSDPLTHLIRNAVDHGIESPSDRTRLGKSAVGQITLKAFHEAGQVNIEISDDGKGLDGKKLASVAVSKSLISEEQARTMSEKEKIDLIFLPGFSTADKISSISGRGVGMDVVKTNLNRLGGQVHIDSEPGKGTTVKIKLPLTLAIIPSLIFSVRGERFAVPQVNLDELIRIPVGQIKDRIEVIGNAEVVRIRDSLLPVLRLAKVLEMRPGCSDMTDTSANGSEGFGGVVNILVVSVNGMRCGLVVDELHDSEEIVVKPLGRHLKHCRGYAGATILGDGRVALILDVASITRMAGLNGLENLDRLAELTCEGAQSSKMFDVQSLLVFRNAPDEQFAVPLNIVARLEKVNIRGVENIGGIRSIKYRGSTLPVFSISELARVKPIENQENLLVIVFVISGKEVGLLAVPPVDVTNISVDFDPVTFRQPGIMGSAIINGHTTLLVDVFELMENLNPEWFAAREAKDGNVKSSGKILLAEDSDFFRNQVKKFIEGAGYEVVATPDGLKAWEVLKSGHHNIALLVTDIEMPELDGLGLTKKVRADENLSDLPIIAVTSLASEEDVFRGKSAGVDDYQIKLDKETLLTSIEHLIRSRKGIFRSGAKAQELKSA